MFDDLISFLSELLKLLPSIGVVLNIVFGLVVVFYERRNPVVTWAWLMVITLLPYLGFIIYLMIGLDSRKHNVFYSKSKRDEKVYDEYIEAGGDSFLSEQSALISDKNILHVPGAEHFNDLIYLNFFSGNGAFTVNNHVKMYFEGGNKFDELLLDIKQAKRFIHLQYYIVRNDETGQRLINALAKKAAEGVDVRFLVDGRGCILTPRRFF
ncbi:MAG: PLDc N-terminal domain-containing protein [Clostridiales bacterium]|jgi:cardiolipin synthase|nr:PLDc N-terminal domain-containing protein [Clostridiales bacterium]